MATEYNHKSVLEYILNHHDDIIDSVDIDSRSPLHIGASNSCADCVKVIRARCSAKVLYLSVLLSDSFKSWS